MTIVDYSRSDWRRRVTMIHQLCFVLLFVAACYGQRNVEPGPVRTPPRSNVMPSNNLPPRNSLLPRNNLVPRDFMRPREDLIRRGNDLSRDSVPVLEPASDAAVVNPTPSIPNNNEAPLTEVPIVTERAMDNRDELIESDNRMLMSGSSWESVCRRRYGYYRVAAKCDSYVECKDFRPIERLCPDGMHYNPEARWPEYPCGYPMDVPCLDRGTVQPPKATAECPHQNGYFPINDASSSERCSRYLMCSEGKAVRMDCPFGLAFDPVNSRCDWPELVPSCKDFLGFRCPTPVLNDGDLQVSTVQNYKYSDNECYYFWSCSEGRARILSCDLGLAFDETAGRCIDEELVRCTRGSDNELPGVIPIQSLRSAY